MRAHFPRPTRLLLYNVLVLTWGLATYMRLRNYGHPHIFFPPACQTLFAVAYWAFLFGLE